MIETFSMTVVNRFPARLQAFFRRGWASSRSFGSQVLLTTGTNLVLAAMALVTGSLTARFLGPAGRGELAAMQTWAVMIALLAALGLPDAVVYFTSRMPQRGGQYLASAVCLHLISAVPFILASWLVLPLLLQAQTPEVISAAQWYTAAFVLLQATQGMLLHPLRGRNDFVPWNLLRILYMVGWLTVLLLAGLLQRATPQFLAVGFLLSLVIVGVPTLLVVMRRVPGPLANDTQVWRPMLSYGLPLALGSVPQMFNLRLDQLMMAALLPPTSLGYYAVAVAWGSAAGPLLNGIGAVLFPRVANASTSSEQISQLGRVMRLSSVCTFGFSLALLLITPLAIITLFGMAFAPAVSAAMILVVASGVNGFNVILEEGARGLGATRVVMWAEMIGLVVTVVALGFLLRPFEIMGAAVASVLGYLTIMIALLAQVRQITRQPILFFLWPRRTDWAAALVQVRALVR